MRVMETLPDRSRSQTSGAGAVVVGVDGSAPHTAAIDWALVEATVHHLAVRLVHVLPPRLRTRHDADREDAARQMLERAAVRAFQHFPHTEVYPEVHRGDPVDRLAELVRGERLLVVGAHAAAPAPRLVGSVTAAIAARCDVPVVVVPEGWVGVEHIGQPVVAGVMRGEEAVPALRFAFRQAARRRAPLVAIHAIEDRPRLRWDPRVERLQARRLMEAELRGVEGSLAPLRAEFSSTSVELVHTVLAPEAALLERAGAAQLVVLGRHRKQGHGATLGSCSRKVLTRATVPVAIVPDTPAEVIP